MRKFFTLFASFMLALVLAACTGTDAGELDVNIGLSEGSFEISDTQLILDEGTTVCFSEDSSIGSVKIQGGQAIRATKKVTLGATGSSGKLTTMATCPLGQGAGTAAPAADATPAYAPMGGGEPATPAQPAYSANWPTAGFDDKEGAMALCISDQAMMRETGITRQIETVAPGDWETCKWQVIPDGQPFSLPADGRYTGRMSDGTHVLWIGPTQVPPSFEGTLRLARGYVVNSFAQTPCDYAAHEVGYADNLRRRTNGEDNIMYALGNFGCPGVQGLLPGGTSVSVDPAAAGVAQCPTSPADAATQLGGNAELWKQSPDDPNLWVYGSPDVEGEYTSDNVKFRYPGYGWFEWWNAPNGQPMREPFPVDETTFHCE